MSEKRDVSEKNRKEEIKSEKDESKLNKTLELDDCPEKDLRPLSEFIANASSKGGPCGREVRPPPRACLFSFCISPQ